MTLTIDHQPLTIMMDDKEQDKLLRAALERRAANVPPLPEDFAERVLKRHRASAVRSTGLRLLWAGNIAAALLVGFFLWPRHQKEMPVPAAPPVLAEVIETETNLPAQAPSAPVKESKEPLRKEKPAPKKPHVEKKTAEKEHSPKGEAGKRLPVIPPDRQALVDIYLAEEALQVEYKLREPLEELRAFYANFDEEEPDTALHIIAI
ncbi:MAG: hypothetical protein J6I86_00460 [Bacteroidaceae bacterium]|nr:hypothetical protein [Bacteroidaceae bacterium]